MTPEERAESPAGLISADVAIIIRMLGEGGHAQAEVEAFPKRVRELIASAITAAVEADGEAKAKLVESHYIPDPNIPDKLTGSDARVIIHQAIAGAKKSIAAAIRARGEK